ncbi:MAG: heterodisulfide reductase-related iron-sulfur binding cluster, partial [Candidatus Nanoarchaeia archaeon]|nr:heterodisulfide reductase-related iron-sulfur binding cluster [Candidatus Jingweiarchaeum tengchongense]
MGIFSRIFGGNVLYYPGCLTKFVAKELGENYKKILRKIGIDFIELKDLEVCCGSPALSAGYNEDVKNLVKKNYEIFKEHSVEKIITACPACFRTFSKEYPSILKEWDIK